MHDTTGHFGAPVVAGEKESGAFGGAMLIF
jgi:hypothetical protein